MTTNVRRLIALVVVGCIAAGVWAMFRGPLLSGSAGPASTSLLVPKKLSVAGFQTVEDARFMEWFAKAEHSPITESVDTHLIKPFSDDVRTRTLTVQGLEVTKQQFAELYSVVKDCAQILNLEKTPRVFISEHTDYPTVTENFSDSVIIIQASILDRFKEPAELRFLIGRELGHVKAGHTRWNTSVRRAKTLADRFSFWRDEGSCLPLMPILQWARECEMTADNAGLICAQDLNTAEQVLVRLATGANGAAATRINIDGYLRQSDAESLSGFSDFAMLWKEWNKTVPFAPNRIRQLRHYDESARFQSLWK